MIQGYFGDSGELFFEIDLVAADGDVFPGQALLDTGFTDSMGMYWRFSSIVNSLAFILLMEEDI